MEIPLSLDNSGIHKTDQGTTWVAYDLSSVQGRYVTVTGTGAFKACPDDQSSSFTPYAGGTGTTFQADVPTPSTNDALTHLVQEGKHILWIASDSGTIEIRINVTSDQI